MLFVFLQAAAAHILYLALHLESGHFPRPLSREDETAAFAALQAGRPDARDKLVRHNLRLVAHVAKKYYATGQDQDDLISIGTIGLMKAVGTFSPARGTRFSSYASQCIENEVRMHLRHRRREGTVLSLQTPLESAGDGGNLTLGDVLPAPGDMVADAEQRDAVQGLMRMLAGLDSRSRQVLAMRYGLGGQIPLTQQEIATRLGISRSYVSRIESRALATLYRKGEQR